MRFFSPKITFAAKASDSSTDESRGGGRASKSLACVHLGVGLGENNNGKNILGFGVLGMEHGG